MQRGQARHVTRHEGIRNPYGIRDPASTEATPLLLAPIFAEVTSDCGCLPCDRSFMREILRCHCIHLLFRSPSGWPAVPSWMLFSSSFNTFGRGRPTKSCYAGLSATLSPRYTACLAVKAARIALTPFAPAG